MVPLLGGAPERNPVGAKASDDSICQEYPGQTSLITEGQYPLWVSVNYRHYCKTYNGETKFERVQVPDAESVNVMIVDFMTSYWLFSRSIRT